MSSNKGTVVITDVGSTTTKALLLDLNNPVPTIVGMYNSPTTVEEPENDVRIGVLAALRGLEQNTGIKLVAQTRDKADLKLVEGVRYFSTSSAGGGLQILVIGLTLFDSASSAKRAAYGAGGIIMDTFAIDDKRKAIQQMLAMRNLHPDMILLCGGVDGGALTGVLRMAELLRVAKPLPKFNTSSKIPTIYAGNEDAAAMIGTMISSEFDLHILPNLRPTLETENLGPTQELIQKLFMENVMEHAPGYAMLKNTVSAPILPTPTGVLNSLKHISSHEARNIFAFDIGGATTDVFSYINSHYQRTVSANLGMSYSALNVAKECGWENIMRWLPETISEQQTRDYIANKCLDPVSIPTGSDEVLIEHALAREALRMALDQHREMHYNTQKIGFLDKLKDTDHDPFEAKFEYIHLQEKYYFQESDIDVIIGAGGIFAHTREPGQNILTLIDAIRPKGITEICVDWDFTTPHLGVLSETEPVEATHLLQHCVERLAIHVAPVCVARTRKCLMRVEVETPSGTRSLEIQAGEFHYFPREAKKVRITCQGKVYLKNKQTEASFETALPLILDSRMDCFKTTPTHAILLNGDQGSLSSEGYHQQILPVPIVKSGEWDHTIDLPYQGDILIQEGQKVQANDVVAVNRHDPPRLFLVDVFKNHRGLTPSQINAALLVKPGDQIDFDQVLAEIPLDYELPQYMRHSRKVSSPVRGKVAFIEPSTGIVVASEIQDYSSKPERLNIAANLGVPPNKISRYLKVNIGDYVYRDDTIASRVDKLTTMFVHSPSTGTVTAIDTKTGLLTIEYLNKAVEYQADIAGVISSIRERNGLTIRYGARRMEGRIGFGKSCHGPLRIISGPEELGAIGQEGCVAVLAFSPDENILKNLAARGIRGLVCYSMHASTLSAYLGFDPGVINTGNETLPFTLLILGGFAALPMPENTMRELQSLVSHNVWISPHTRIRAGVVRPFLAISN